MSVLNRTQNWLIEPRGVTRLSGEYRKARLTASFLLIVLVSLLLEQIIGGNTPLLMPLFLLPIYILARTRYYSLAALIMIASLSFPSFMVAATLPTYNVDKITIAFMWLSLPLVLASLLLSFRAVYLVATINFGGIWVLVFWHPEIMLFMVSGALGYVGILSLFVALVTHQRNLLEQDRRQELERANQALQANEEQLEAIVATRTQALMDAQAELVQQESLAILGKLAGIIAHELRNPLSVVANCAYFLKTIGVASPPQMYEYLDIINDQVRRAAAMISNLLTFSESEAPQAETMDIVELVRAVLEQCPPPTNIQLTTKVPTKLPLLQADREQMAQIFTHVITNAYDAMPNGGQLSIDVALPAEQVQVQIRDTGTGMSTETLGQVFDPLFSTKIHGFGLGLPIVKNLVALNNGHVHIESQEGQGSIITLTWPHQKITKVEFPYVRPRVG